jgi:hypothetical protein
VRDESTAKIPGICLTADQWLRARSDVRTAGIQTLGGFVILLGAYLTLRQLQHNIEASRRDHELTRQGQITDRFTRAIDQLGSADVAVRLGGIYTLERIARDSPTDRRAINEILAAYVRLHSPRAADEALEPSSSEMRMTAWRQLTDTARLYLRAPDVQAAVTVLGRAAPVVDSERGLTTRGVHRETLVLNRVDLRRADLRGGNFSHADMYGTNLQKAWMNEANLEGSSLQRAHLQWAYLANANLRNADLRHADLFGAAIDGTDFTGARASESTLWPEGLDWKGAGVSMEEYEPSKYTGGSGPKPIK